MNSVLYRGAGPLWTPGKPAVATFSPADLAGLKLWLKADAIAGKSDGNTVAAAEWPDSSGNGNGPTSATGGVYKTGILNGKPVVRFVAASQQFYQLPNLMAGSAAGAAFVVVKITNDPPINAIVTGNPLGDWGSDVASSDHYPYTDGIIYHDFGSNGRKTVGNPTPSLAAWRRYCVISAAGDWRAYLDNALLFSTGTNTVSWGTAPRICGTSQGYYTDGDVAEVIAYGSALADADRNSVDAYLAAKYGL